MAKQPNQEAAAAQAEKQKLQSEKKQLKNQQKQQRREAKQRAKEIAKQEDALAEDEESNGALTVVATILIVALWLAVICVVIKLDVGGFGSNVLKPVLKDVPLINKILPGSSITETTDGEAYGGYTSLQDAVAQIKRLELELEQAQSGTNTKDQEISELKAEVLRLREFESAQAEFDRLQSKFYEEVVYSEKGPGAEAFMEYYESMDPATADYIYKQVVTQQAENKETQDLADTYASMKPKAAAAVFEQMTDSLDTVAKFLKLMSAEERGDILGAMDPAVASKITKIMSSAS